MSDSSKAAAKARLLVDQNRVILIDTEPGDVWAWVIGDSDTYEVRFRPHGAFCQCRWFRAKGWQSPCSHILAVRLALDTPASQEVVKRLAERLGKRKPPIGKTLRCRACDKDVCISDVISVWYPAENRTHYECSRCRSERRFRRGG